MGKISDVIDSRLEELGIKGSKMCDDLGISRSTLTELRKGRAVTLKADRATAIAGYLGISVEELLGAKTEKAPTPVSESGQHINIVKIAGRDGSYKEKRLTDEQVKALQTIIDQMPEAPEDL